MPTATIGSPQTIALGAADALIVSCSAVDAVASVAGSTGFIGAPYELGRVVGETGRKFGPYGRAVSLIVSSLSGSITAEVSQPSRVGDGADALSTLQGSAAQGVVSGGGIADQVATLQQQDRSRPLFSWIIGDRQTAESVAVGTPYASWAVDMAGYIDGTIVIVLTGGTPSLTYQASDDGVVWSAAMPLTAAAAGTYYYRLSAMAPARFIRLSLSASGSTVTARAFVMGTSARDGMPWRYARRPVIGDGGANVSLAASGTVVSPPIDLRRAIRSKSYLVITVGSGTVKVSAQVSRDGIRDMVSVGDLQTDMAAGTYRISLDGWAYGHFVTITVTETAASTASVTGYATMALADSWVSQTNVRRAAIVLPYAGFAGSYWSAQYQQGAMNTYRALERMGYDVEFVPLVATSTAFDGGERLYELAVVPLLIADGTWSTWTSGSGQPFGRLIKGATAIPTFALGISDTSNVQIQAAVGAYTGGATSYQKALWGSAPFLWRYKSYTLDTQAHMTALATFVTDQGGASAAWRFNGAKGAVYCGTGAQTSGDGSLLLLMMAEAITRGDLAAPPNKALCVLDIDDFPDVSGNYSSIMETTADMDRVYAALLRLSAPITAGIQADHLDAASLTPALRAWIVSHSAASGGLIYPIAHSGSWMPKSAKTTVDTSYRNDIANMQAVGIVAGTTDAPLAAWGYTYANNNAWGEGALQLGQPGSSFTASPDNFTTQSGYGWRVIRAFQRGGNNTASIGAPEFDAFGDCFYRGMTVVGSAYYIPDTATNLDPYDGSTGSTSFASQMWRFFNLCAGAGLVQYIHGSNTYSGHDGANAPGTVWLEHLAGLYEAGLRNVVTFGHGSALAAA